MLKPAPDSARLTMSSVATMLMAGAAGAMVSTVIASAALAGPVPEPLVCVAVRLCAPAVSALVVMLQFPAPSTTAEPTAPSKLLVRLTVAPISPVPLMIGVVTLVMSSMLLLPLSLAVARSSAAGAKGTPELMVTVLVAVRPPASVVRMVSVSPAKPTVPV